MIGIVYNKPYILFFMFIIRPFLCFGQHGYDGKKIIPRLKKVVNKEDRGLGKAVPRLLSMPFLQQSLYAYTYGIPLSSGHRNAVVSNRIILNRVHPNIVKIVKIYNRISI